MPVDRPAPTLPPTGLTRRSGPSRSTATPTTAAALALLLALTALLSGCGRPAPDDAAAGSPDPATDHGGDGGFAVDAGGEGGDGLPAGQGGPDVAGVTITSPDAVIDPSADPGIPVTPAPGSTGEPQGTYTVLAGDTLWVIAARYDITVDELASANGITDVNDLSPGEELVIPAITPVDVTVVDAAEQAPVGGAGS